MELARRNKLLVVYMTLDEILPHIRSSIDTMQLVMLCMESDYNFFWTRESVLLIKDLKDTEQSDITLETGETPKGVVIAIAMDNLGWH